jgi:hypothetical protein
MFLLKMLSTLYLNANELVKNNLLYNLKNFKKQMIVISFAFFFIACEDKYITKVYDTNKINEKVECMSLKIIPHSNDIYQSMVKLYKFDDNCSNVLQITYKNNIICNSHFSTNKNVDSYINLELFTNDKRVYSVYKDFKESNITIEIKKGYNKLCKKIKI